MNSIGDLIESQSSKLEKLKLLSKNAEYYLAEHFYSLRNDVDIDCEERLLRLDHSDSAVAGQLNRQRADFIEVINQNEQQSLLQYSLNQHKLVSELGDKLVGIRERLDKIRSSIKSGLSEDEASGDTGLSAFCKRLEDDLDQEIHGFLGAIFNSRTLIYKSQLSKRALLELGKLFVVDEYLTKNEVELVK